MESKIELLKKVYQVVGGAAEIGGRRADDVRLIGVSKRKPAQLIRDFRRAGLRDFGENYVQEFLDKYEELKDEDIVWHFIGSLQRNKVKYIVDKVAMIHTVDSVKLAAEIEKQAEKKEIPFIDVLIQVNVGKEEQKGGIEENELAAAFEEISKMNHLRVRGLMSIPPFLEAEELRPYHRRLREVYLRLVRDFSLDQDVFSELSMGMSADFDVAIEEGATMVRVGTLIFGERG